MTQSLSGITVDVESDWGGRCAPNAETLRGCEIGLPLILDALERRGLKATFFISGRVAEVAPEFVFMIVAGGHEVASHGYDHTDYLSLGRSQLQYQLQKSKDILEQCSQASVSGFRSPQFRIPDQLFSALSAAGYAYDSSVVLGSLPGRYKNSVSAIARAKKAGIIEIPLRTIPLIGAPFGLLWITKIGVPIATRLLALKRHAGEACPMDYVLYCHPFDFIERPDNARAQNLFVRLWYCHLWGSSMRAFDKSIDFLSDRYSIRTLGTFALEGAAIAHV